MKKGELKLEKLFQYAFLGLLILQIAILFYFNMVRLPHMIDADSADAYYHMVQIVKNGTLNIPNWNHTTTLEIDSALLFAIPIYAITKNLFLSIGIANMCIIALYISVISTIMYYAKVKRTYIFMTLCFILTPWSFGMLEYVNMLFFGASQYAIKTLVPLLAVLVSILFTRYGELPKQGKLLAQLTGILYLALLFVTSLSTGSYVILCGIFPVILSLLLDFWLRGTIEGKYKIPRLIFFVVSIFVFMLGYKLYHDTFLLPSKYNMNLTRTDDLESMVKACFAGVFQVFGAISNEEIKGMSMEGIYYCLKKVVVCFLLIVSITNILQIFQKKEKTWIKRTLNCVFVFNFLLLLVYDTRFTGIEQLEYRYLLIGVIPLMVFAGILINDWSPKWNAFQEYSIYVICGIVLIGCMIGNNLTVYAQKDKTTYAIEVCDYIQNLDVDSLIFINDENTANLCRALDTEHRFGAFDATEQQMELSICSYLNENDPAFYGEKNALAVVTGTSLTDHISAEAATHYTQVGTVRWYDIYVSDNTVFSW